MSDIECLHTIILLFWVLFDFILYVPSTIFQLNRDRSSWVEPVQSWDKCVLLKDHNAVRQVRLEPAAPQSQVKHSYLFLVLCFNRSRKILNFPKIVTFFILHGSIQPCCIVNVLKDLYKS